MGFRSYTAAEYRAAGPNAGPFALEGNPDPEKQNYRTSRRKPILGVVMHITAGMSDYTLPDTSAEGTTKYGADTTRDASWHVCIDSDGIIPSIRDSYVAWHAGVADIPNVNDATLGIEQGTGDTNWDVKPKAWVDATIRNVAVWLAPRVKAYGIPLTVCRDRDVMDQAIRAGKKFGFISHGTVSPTNRTDPGLVNGRDTYPWDLLFQYIREELAGNITTEEFDMATAASIESKIDTLMTQEGGRYSDLVARLTNQAAQIGALSAALTAISNDSDLSADEITAAAKAGAQAALDEKIASADVNLNVTPSA